MEIQPPSMSTIRPPLQPRAMRLDWTGAVLGESYLREGCGVVNKMPVMAGTKRFAATATPNVGVVLCQF